MMVGGKKISAAIETILMILFCSILIFPKQTSKRKSSFCERKEALSFSGEMSSIKL